MYFVLCRYHRNNMPDKVCVYNFSEPDTWLCNIFKLGDMVRSAGGNYTQLSVSGGVVAIHIQWICNLDWDFMKYCLPKYVDATTTQPQSNNHKKQSLIKEHYFLLRNF